MGISLVKAVFEPKCNRTVRVRTFVPALLVALVLWDDVFTDAVALTLDGWLVVVAGVIVSEAFCNASESWAVEL